MRREARRGAPAAPTAIPNNSLMRAQGFTDPREDALKLMARLSYPTLYDPAQPRLGLPRLQYRLLATFYDQASPAVDRLIQLGALDPIDPAQLRHLSQPASRIRSTSRGCPRTRPPMAAC